MSDTIAVKKRPGPKARNPKPPALLLSGLPKEEIIRLALLKHLVIRHAITLSPDTAVEEIRHQHALATTHRPTHTPLPNIKLTLKPGALDHLVKVFKVKRGRPKKKK